MAFVPLTPVTLSPTCTAGAKQQFLSPVINDPAGSAIDLSGWDSFAAKCVPLAAGPAAADNSFGTVTGQADGKLKLIVAESDFTDAEAGTAKLIITGKPTSGDPSQLVCSGTITVQQG